MREEYANDLSDPRPPHRRNRRGQPEQGRPGSGGVGTARPGLLVRLRHGLDGDKAAVGTDNDPG